MPRTALMTRELLRVHDRNTGHAGMNALFSKAHSMDWDIDRDVDWSLEVRDDDPCVDPAWATLGRTPTFQSLPGEVQVQLTRRELARTLNVLQVGESVAQDVCAKLALLCEEEDYRNHAVAQAMDEARHHLAYVRFLEKMGVTEPPNIDSGTEELFDALLETDDVAVLIATEQFFLESLAMRIFERMVEHATHPLLRDIVALVKRDESRHMGFGVLWVSRHLAGLDDAGRYAFASQWLPRILDRGGPPGPRMVERTARRLADAGVSGAEDRAARMVEEQRAIVEADREEAASGRRVSQLLTSARRAGLLAPDILRELGVADDPLVRAALRSPAAAA